MVIILTDEQIVRVLEITEKIAATKRELPTPPRGFNVDIETAKYLRSSLEAKNDLLLELGALLR